jgi:hypothetical protein
MCARRLFLVFFAVSAMMQATAQQSRELPAASFGLRTHYGFLFAHHPEMRHLTGSHFGSLEVNYQRNFSGKKTWHHDYNFPFWGISGLYYSFPNPALGNAHAIFPYIALPLNSGYTARLNFVAGAGAAYLTNRFDRVSNHKNIAMSTGLNVALRLGLEGHFRISPRISANTGIFITHFSNGALKLPNLGINIFSAHVGASYHFGQKINLNRNSEAFEKVPGLIYSLFAGVGLKKVEVGQKPFNFTGSMQFLAEKRISKKISLGLGADLNLNTSRQRQYEMKGNNNVAISPLRAGISGSAIYHFGQMQIVSQLGVYVLDKYSMDGSVFNRFGIRHYIGKNMLANLTLRTHFGKADHVEAGLVYIFNQK